jgi:hypothetical protein
MPSKFYNPFIEKRHELRVDRNGGARFLGKAMFWQHLDKIHTKHVYRASSVEYRSLKLMVTETILFMMVAILFSVTVSLVYSNPVTESVVQLNSEWFHGAQHVSSVNELWDWLSGTFVPAVYSSSSSFPDSTAQVTSPPEWLSWDHDQLGHFVERHSVFSLDAYPGFAPQFTGGSPKLSNVLLGPVRIRQYAENGGLEITQKTPPNVAIADAFTWYPASITQQNKISSRATRKTYPGSGFVYDFTLTESNTLDQLGVLKATNWIDANTRAIICEVSVLNSRVGTVTDTQILFEVDAEEKVIGSESYSIPIQPVPAGFPSSFVMTIVTFASFTAYGIFLIDLLLVVGPRDFFTYAWNLVDVVVVVLYFVYMIEHLIDSSSIPTCLDPVVGVIQSVFKPYGVYSDLVRTERTLVSMISILMWIRLVKPLALIRPFRTAVKVFERCIGTLSILLVPVIAIAAVLAALFSVAYPEARFFRTWSDSFYSMFFLYSHSLDLLSTIGDDSWYSALLLAVYLILMWLVVPAACIATVFVTYMSYKEEIREAMDTIASDRLALHPQGINPNSWWHRDVVTAFIYTWLFRIRGIELFKESEEDIGYPEEQSIETRLLPDIVQRRWQEKRAELIEISEHRLQKGSMLKSSHSSKFGVRISRVMSALSRTRTEVITKLKSLGSIVDIDRHGSHHQIEASTSVSSISRIQLQRLLDSDPELVEILRQQGDIEEEQRVSTPGSSPPSSPSSDVVPGVQKPRLRAIDVIRKYSAPEALKKVIILDSLLSKTTTLRTDSSGDGVKLGLRDLTQELEISWKEQVAYIMEAMASLTEDLNELKKEFAPRVSRSSIKSGSSSR